jgi:hypothetical protein
MAQSKIDKELEELFNREIRKQFSTQIKINKLLYFIILFLLGLITTIILLMIR